MACQVGITFSKLHGAQNDFVAIDNRDGQVQLTSRQRQLMCDRHLGIGADGNFEIHSSEVADFKLVHYSSKGERTGLCGNGTRCAVRFCKQLGLPLRTIKEFNETDSQAESHFPVSEYPDVEHEICKYGFPKNYYTFEFFDGLHFGSMSEPEGDECFIRCCSVDLSDIKVYKNGDFFLDTGSPHHVKFVPSVDDVAAEKTGRLIVGDLYPDSGSHVNFVCEKRTEGVMPVLRARTYEFTVDYETMACGTGTIAVAISDAIRRMVLESGHKLEGKGQPGEMASMSLEEIVGGVCKSEGLGENGGGRTFHTRVEMRGGVLHVHFQMNEKKVHSVWLQGPARHVMDGRYWP